MKNKDRMAVVRAARFGKTPNLEYLTDFLLQMPKKESATQSGHTASIEE